LELVENGLLRNAAEVGAYTLDALAEIQARHPCMGDVRGRGLMIGVEFVKDRVGKHPAKHLREAIVDRAFEHGLLLLGCGDSTIRIAPPLVIDRGLIDEGLEIFEDAITKNEKSRLD
jgi:4-aminobutyrate aminotransferase